MQDPPRPDSSAYWHRFGALSMTGNAVLPNGGVVQATCGSAANTEIELITARMTAVKVDTIETQ